MGIDLLSCLQKQEAYMRIPLVHDIFVCKIVNPLRFFVLLVKFDLNPIFVYQLLACKFIEIVFVYFFL